MKPLLIAHRCGPGKYPEQSIFSAQYALQCHADIVEMDVQFTSDGVPVICHDPNTDRMFGVDCLVSDLSHLEFMALRHKENCAYASHTLDDILTAGIAPLLLHQKLTGEPLREVMRHLIKYHYEEKAIMGIQYPEDVELVKEMSHKTQTLAFMPTLDLLDDFLNTRTNVIRLWEEWVTQERINLIHQSGHQVWIMAGDPSPDGVGYTSEENIRMWMEMGVDGILVNDIPWADKIIHG